MRFTNFQSTLGGWAKDLQGDAAREEASSWWSSSPTLQKIYQGLEAQQRVIDQLKHYLQERAAPFQRHMDEQRRHNDQAMKHLEKRLAPLRQYIHDETQHLGRVTAHLDSGLRDQFEAFEEVLASQRGLLEKANRYIEEQPQPLFAYLEDERQTIEMIYQDLEQRLDAFLQNLSEQQKILDSLREPALTSEYEALAEYLEQRQGALAQYARSGEYRPAELFAQLEEAANRYKPLHPVQNTLFARVFEETRLADEKLREALSVPRTSLSQEPEGDDRPASPQDNSTEAFWKRVHERVPVQFDVAYTHAGRAIDGIGLNVSQSGMFIATERPIPPGAEVLLDFTPPGPSEPLSVHARVAWVCTQEGGSSAIAGMGVQFLVVDPLKAALIGAVVDRLRGEASPSLDSS